MCLAVPVSTLIALYTFVLSPPSNRWLWEFLPTIASPSRLTTLSLVKTREKKRICSLLSQNVTQNSNVCVWLQPTLDIGLVDCSASVYYHLLKRVRLKTVQDKITFLFLHFSGCDRDPSMKELLCGRVHIDCTPYPRLCDNDTLLLYLPRERSRILDVCAVPVKAHQGENDVVRFL